MGHVLKLEDITTEEYFSMDPITLSRAMRTFSANNKKWMIAMLPPTTTWAYVSLDQGIWGKGEGDVIPSTTQTREAAKWIHKPLFLLTRSQQNYRDRTYFMEENIADHAAHITGIPSHFFQPYIDKTSGIVAVNAQSGKANELKGEYAIGALATMKPRHDDSEERYHMGATVAEIRHVGWNHAETVLYIASQTAEEVHARGGTVRGERKGENRNIRRIERLHRFDDPIVDIFDTYRMKREDSWKPLILCGQRALYDTHMEESFIPKLLNYHPQKETSL